MVTMFVTVGEVGPGPEQLHCSKCCIKLAARRQFTNAAEVVARRQAG